MGRPPGQQARFAQAGEAFEDRGGGRQHDQRTAPGHRETGGVGEGRRRRERGGHEPVAEGLVGRDSTGQPEHPAVENVFAEHDAARVVAHEIGDDLGEVLQDVHASPSAQPLAASADSMLWRVSASTTSWNVCVH